MYRTTVKDPRLEDTWKDHPPDILVSASPPVGGKGFIAEPESTPAANHVAGGASTKAEGEATAATDEFKSSPDKVSHTVSHKVSQVGGFPHRHLLLRAAESEGQQSPQESSTLASSSPSHCMATKSVVTLQPAVMNVSLAPVHPWKPGPYTPPHLRAKGLATYPPSLACAAVETETGPNTADMKEMEADRIVSPHGTYLAGPYTPPHLRSKELAAYPTVAELNGQMQQALQVNQQAHTKDILQFEERQGSDATALGGGTSVTV